MISVDRSSRMAFTVIRGHTSHVKTQVKLGPSIKKLHRIQDQLLVLAKSHAPPPLSNFLVTCIITVLITYVWQVIVHDKSWPGWLVSCPAHVCLPARNGLVNKSNFLGSFLKNGKKLHNPGT